MASQEAELCENHYLKRQGATAGTRTYTGLVPVTGEERGGSASSWDMYVKVQFLLWACDVRGDIQDDFMLFDRYVEWSVLMNVLLV